MAVTETQGSCVGFPDWQTSPYVLPYAAGTSHLVDQANCSPPGNGHRGTARYGYDFLMPIGTRVTTARGGVVVLLEESHFDGEIAATGKDNYLYIGWERRESAMDLRLARVASQLIPR